MFYIKSEESFDSAHFLKDYEGKCRNVHGHRWRVVAEVKGEELSEEEQTRGMLFDFSELKNTLKELCEELDHCMIYEQGSLKEKTIEVLKEEGFKMIEVAFRPTAENFACYFYKKFEEKGYWVHRVEVYETPNNCAVYEE
jgi:6-pyruvoyltetrahydropterin/6-carboxytetrahydropterin synthase